MSEIVSVFMGLVVLGSDMTFQNFRVSWDASDEGCYLRAFAKRMLNDRLNRGEFLPISLFSEAGWDAILMLFSGERGLSDCAESLARRLDLPLTTMSRWIAVLENEGMIESRPPSLLPERQAVRLSIAGGDAVQAYLRATISQG